jgi:5-methylcytosine-specific restriction endonuclease McrA
MTTQRRLTAKDATPSKKGAHGHRLCRWCEKEVMPPQKTFCGPDCVHEWKLRSDVAYLRSQLFLRDKGICRDCGLDTLKLRRRMYDLSESERVSMGMSFGIPAHQSKNLMLWEADHVVPVSQGGGLTGLDNFQSLCVTCHYKKSAKERR